MSGEFLGTFHIAVNKQKWVTLPAVLKKKFSTNSKQKLIITIGPQKNIVIYPLDNWNEKITTLREKGTPRDITMLHNLRYFASSEQKMENNGRIKISDELIELASISNKVMIKGEGSFISIWNPERYKEVREKTILEHMRMFKSEDYQT